MKYVLYFLICFTFSSVFGQQGFSPVKRDSVQMLIKDSTLDSYYPKLVERLNHFDTTLSLQEYRLLYYGFVFQDGYNGYYDHKQSMIRKAMDEKDYRTVTSLCDSVLAICPISLSANFYKGIALYLSNQPDFVFKKYSRRFNNLLNAIISTGDGMKCESAFKTIFVSDEYTVIYNYFEIKSVRGQAYRNPCDKISISPNEHFKSKAIFFDTSETILSIDKMFGPKEK